MPTKKVESLRRKLQKLKGSHADKAVLLGTSASWVTKFQRGEITEPRAELYERLIEVLK